MWSWLPITLAMKISLHDEQIDMPIDINWILINWHRFMYFYDVCTKTIKDPSLAVRMCLHKNQFWEVIQWLKAIKLMCR